MTRANYALLLHGSGQQDQVAREQLEQLVLLCTQRLGAKWVVPHMVPYSTKGMHGMGWGPSGWSRTWSRTPPRGCTGWDGGSKAAALGPLISPDPLSQAPPHPYDPQQSGTAASGTAVRVNIFPS